MISSRDIANYSIGHSSGQAVTFSKNTVLRSYVMFKDVLKHSFNSSYSQHLLEGRISENLVKNFNEVKRSLLIRISEIPFDMHNYRPI